LYSADEERKAMHGFRISLNREKLNENGEEGYKIQLKDVYSSKDRCQG
jgi:hypothetical protein